MSGNNDYINLIISLLDDIKSYCVGSGLTFVGFCVMKRNYSLDFMYRWDLSSKIPLYSGYFDKSKIFWKKLPDYLVISIKIPIFVP